ncbi:hypothetical protein LX32DRAFT_714235 [Colletotrichum zoysiae]|uniref:Uncharacterized protein n=1 Tax=Colletotrichum zoysiae TaxID=1216348 RepID=A0AAD9H263_9PEZI|nr:hypothetical protein LX32DRAFT_714235 [Colletotrichum zoysiae]
MAGVILFSPSSHAIPLTNQAPKPGRTLPAQATEGGGEVHLPNAQCMKPVPFVTHERVGSSNFKRLSSSTFTNPCVWAFCHPNQP